MPFVTGIDGSDSKPSICLPEHAINTDEKVSIPNFLYSDLFQGMQANCNEVVKIQTVSQLINVVP